MDYDRFSSREFPHKAFNKIFPAQTVPLAVSMLGHSGFILGAVFLNALAFVVLSLEFSVWAVAALILVEVRDGEEERGREGEKERSVRERERGREREREREREMRPSHLTKQPLLPRSTLFTASSSFAEINLCGRTRTSANKYH